MKELLKHQYGILIVVLQLTLKVAMLPSLLAEKSGTDCYLSVLVLVAIELFTLVFVIWVSKNNGMDSFKERFGKSAYFALLVVLSANFFIKGLLLLMETLNYICLYLFYNINHLPIMIVLLMTFFYVIIKGPRAVARLAELAVWLVPVGIVLGLVFGQMKLDADLVKPFFGEGAKRVFGSANEYLFYVADFTPLMFLKIKDTKKPYIALCTAISCISVIVFYLVFVMNYGNAATYMGNAFARLALFNVVDSEIGSTDWPFITAWLFMCVVMIAVSALPFVELTKTLNLQKSFCIALILAAIGGVSLFALKNLETTLRFVRGGVKYFCLVVQVAAPLIVFAATKLGRGKEATVEQGI